MKDFFEKLNKKSIQLPDNIRDILSQNKQCNCFNSTSELLEVATGGAKDGIFEVEYDIPGKGAYTEAIVLKVKNGLSANYTEAYMRRRDPDTMSIADDKPTDKIHFRDKYDFEFSELQLETFNWLKSQSGPWGKVNNYN